MRLLALLLLLCAGAAQAAVFHLDGVTFSDGGAATGYFIVSGPFNTSNLTQWDITVTGGSLPAFEFASPRGPENTGNVAVWEGGEPVLFFGVPGLRILQILLPINASATVENGTVQLTRDSYDSVPGHFRSVTSGQLIVNDQLIQSVPEPRAWVMVLLGAVVVGLMRIRRRPRA